MDRETKPVSEDLSGLVDRISVSAARVRDLREQLAHEIAIRDGLIIDAVDHAGVRQRDVATAAGISIPTITGILSRSSED